MSNRIVLIENLTPKVANMVSESKKHEDGKNTYLSGIWMQAECVNGNERSYPLMEIQKAVNDINARISEGFFIPGELNHPEHLNIDLERVSHIITEMKMVGNNAIGKALIVDDAPMGRIAIALIEKGLKLGVSSRGTGIINEGKVSDFTFITADIVATPSAPNAYPTAIREGIEYLSNGKEIIKLAEAVIHDNAAQKYFIKEMKTFIDMLTRK